MARVVQAGTIEAVATVQDAMSGPLAKMSANWGRLAGQAAAGGAAVAGVAAIAGTAVSAFAEFEGAMNRVRAISGATGEQMRSMGDLAQEMGARTRFSAQESADALGFLAMAGLDVEQTMTALPGTLSLAAAGGLELARAADLVTNVMSGFALEIEDLPRLNDVLATTAANANTNVEQLGSAMKFVAPVAAAAGLSIEETAAAIGTLSSAGIQGEMAGTALRGALTKLLNQSGPAKKVMAELGAAIGQSTIAITDAEGAMLPFADIVDQLQRAGLSASDAMTIFGQRAGPGMLALVSAGSAGLREFTSELGAAEGAAARMAETQLGGLYGAFVRMESAIETVWIALGQQLAPAFEPVVNAITRLVGWIAQSETTLKLFGVVLSTTVVTGLVAVTTALYAMVPAITAATGGLNLVIPGIVAGISAVVSAIVIWRKEIADFLGRTWNRFIQAIEWARGPLVALARVMGEDVTENLDHMKVQVGEAREEVETLEPAVREVAQSQVEAAEASDRFGDAAVAAATRAVEAQARLVVSLDEVSRAVEERALAATGRWRDEWTRVSAEVPTLLVQDVQSNPAWAELQKVVPEVVLDPVSFAEAADPAMEEVRRVTAEKAATFAEGVSTAMLRGQSMAEAMRNALEADVVSSAVRTAATAIGDVMASGLTSVLGSRLAAAFAGPLAGIAAGFISGIIGRLAGAIGSVFSGGKAGTARSMGATKFRMTSQGAQYFVNGQWVDASGNPVGGGSTSTTTGPKSTGQPEGTKEINIGGERIWIGTDLIKEGEEETKTPTPTPTPTPINIDTTINVGTDVDPRDVASAVNTANEKLASDVRRALEENTSGISSRFV